MTCTLDLYLFHFVLTLFSAIGCNWGIINYIYLKCTVGCVLTHAHVSDSITTLKKKNSAHALRSPCRPPRSSIGTSDLPRHCGLVCTFWNFLCMDSDSMSSFSTGFFYCA